MKNIFIIKKGGSTETFGDNDLSSSFTLTRLCQDNGNITKSHFSSYIHYNSPYNCRTV